MKRLYKYIASIAVLGTVSVVPIIPDGGMVFRYAYEHTYFQPHIRVTATSTVVISDTFAFPDTDNDGVEYIAVFEDSFGVEHSVVIDKKLYSDMGKIDGAKNNPKKEQYKSILGNFIPQVDAAIATDATSKGSASATSVTVAHTITGSNPILFVGLWVQDPAGDLVTGVTYNSVGMTQAGKVISGTVGDIYIYYLTNPSTGTNNIVASKTGTDLFYVLGSSYTGAKQSGQPDASNTNTASAATSITTSVTTVADNSWTLIMMKSTDVTNTAGTDTTLRLDGPGNDATGIYDSNGALTPAGSKSLQVTAGTSRNWETVMVSFAPAVASATLTPILDLVKSFWW